MLKHRYMNISLYLYYISKYMLVTTQFPLFKLSFSEMFVSSHNIAETHRGIRLLLKMTYFIYENMRIVGIYINHA
ncbi:hypothetical protein V1478_018233 [Vespula squamosa]|uniref:Uncharacterized protein n=1 Tax=Vespula squamosa TaxID=30214 RepID=A0ABD1ZUF5_VESSQ